VAGIIGPRIGGYFYTQTHSYKGAFMWAAVLAAVALVCEMLAKRPSVPKTVTGNLMRVA
jgi:cyanate permease